MRVENMTSPRTGRPVANQFIIDDCDKTVFQSYNSTIVEIDWKHGIIVVFEDWDYSATTGKYRNKFMEDMGFDDMATKQGFAKCMNDGKYEEFEIYKDWEIYDNLESAIAFKNYVNSKGV